MELVLGQRLDKFEISYLNSEKPNLDDDAKVTLRSMLLDAGYSKVRDDVYARPSEDRTIEVFTEYDPTRNGETVAHMRLENISLLEDYCRLSYCCTKKKTRVGIAASVGGVIGSLFALLSGIAIQGEISRGQGGSASLYLVTSTMVAAGISLGGVIGYVNGKEADKLRKRLASEYSSISTGRDAILKALRRDELQ